MWTDAQSGAPVVIAWIAKNGRERVRVALDQYRGCDLVDVRVFAEPFTATGSPAPTAKGISLAIGRLPELARALAEAETRARELGLIGDAAA